MDKISLHCWVKSRTPHIPRGTEREIILVQGKRPRAPSREQGRAFFHHGLKYIAFLNESWESTHPAVNKNTADAAGRTKPKYAFTKNNFIQFQNERWNNKHRAIHSRTGDALRATMIQATTKATGPATRSSLKALGPRWGPVFLINEICIITP